jgi:lipid II:glycine glycyltransferase (peptidoglycan interpeptide bridge formation enzyme)
MEQIYRCKSSGMTVFLIRDLGAERVEAEREVVEAGLLMPISHRAAWAANFYRLEPWFLLARDSKGRACGGFAIEQVLTRALPGHKILRVRRTGGNVPIEVFKPMLAGLKVLVHKFPRILSVHMQVFSKERLDEIGHVLARYGYRELVPPTVYQHTLVMDLTPSEDDIFAKFSDSGRNKVRKTIRKSGQSVIISDPKYAARIGELQQAALNRTGGRIATEDWRAVLKMSQEQPELSRVFGLFLGEDESPENMAAFGWVCIHGDYGEYRAAGSTRNPDVKIPYGYLVAWDMIRWAKAAGANWFDFGGVTLSNGSADPLQGISDFKRSFSRDVAKVGAEWLYDPRPVRAQIASTVSQSMRHLQDWMKSKN